jgi:hypothetical protein
MSLSSLLEASAKGMESFAQSIIFVYRMFTVSFWIVNVCQGLHVIDTDCYVRLYSALNVCSGLCLVVTDSYVRLYTDIHDSDRPHCLLYCRQLSCLVGLTIHELLSPVS